MSDESDGIGRILNEAGITVPGAEQTRFRLVEESEEVHRIELPREGRHLSVFAKELAELLRDGTGYFVRDGEVVRVNEEMKALVPVSSQAFRVDVEKWVRPFKRSFGKNGSSDFDDTMSKETAATCLESEVFKAGLHKVERIHDQRLPVLRRDGRIERLEPGLDVDSGVYTLPGSIDYRMDMPVAEARRMWRDIFCEFPFGDWTEGGWVEGQSRSFAVLTACALSQFAWCLVSSEAARMNFLFHSNSQRSGKSLLAQICLVLTHGLVATSSWKKDEEKMAQTLDVIVRNRSLYAFFDNLKGHLASEEVEAFMTGSARKVRLFHTQIERVFPNRTSCVISANTATWSTDLDGRLLVCDLYLEEANPQDRTVRVVRNESSFREPGLRGDMLAAMWAMVRAWDEAKKPAGSRSKAGFQEWCRIFGGIVEHAGFGNPLEPRPEELSGGNTDFSDMLAVVEKLAMGQDGVLEFKFGDVVQAALDVNAFEWLMKGKERKDESDTLGRTTFVLDPSERRKFSDILSATYGGRVFTLSDGRKARWGFRGKNRGRHYQVSVFPAESGPG